MSHSRETVTADPGPPAAGPYSHAVKSGGLLFISGQVHLDPDTGKLIEGSPAEKAKRCLDNLTIIAEAAGAKLENAVRVAVYVVDISVFAEMNEAYAGYFPQRSAGPHHDRRRRAPDGRRGRDGRDHRAMTDPGHTSVRPDTPTPGTRGRWSANDRHRA